MKWKAYMQEADILLARKLYEDSLLEARLLVFLTLVLIIYRYLQTCFSKLKDHAAKMRKAKFSLLKQVIKFLHFA